MTAKPLKRRIVAIALGAVLAIYAVLNFVSHQGLRASQNQSRGQKAGCAGENDDSGGQRKQ